MLSENNKWPLPKFDNNNQPHFLFIITPPCSGSTALSQLLNTSDKTMILQNRGEGQWLIPGLCDKDRWSEKKEVNYSSVKAVWLNKYQEQRRLNQNINVVIEKSPPNMMRIEKLSSQFKNFSLIANNRNPYANCASILYRRNNADNLNSDQRKKILSDLLQGWLSKSIKIQELVSNPSDILDLLNLPDGISETINTSACVKVKDYDVQPIINQNERQISNLKSKEIEWLSNSLKASSNLLKFFSYQLL